MDQSVQLTGEDQELLTEIEELGAATAIELAVRTLHQPDEVRPKLEQLRQAGLLKVRSRNSDYEPNIYLLTSEGKEYVRPNHDRRRVDS